MTNGGHILVFHHKGYFMHTPTLMYVSGEVDVQDYLDIDKVSIPMIDQEYRYDGYASV